MGCSLPTCSVYSTGWASARPPCVVCLQPPAGTKLPPGAEGLRRVGALRPRYVPGCVLGAAVAFRRLFLLFGAGPGVRSETGASACETELEEK